MFVIGLGGKRRTLTLLISFLISYPSIENETSAVIAIIYGVFIETRYFIFLAVLKKKCLKVLTRCKRRSPVIVPRKQFVYQKSNCCSTVRSRG